MTKVTVEIEDNLDELIDGVVSDLTGILFDAVEDDVDLYTNFDQMVDQVLQYNGTLSEYVDSAVPIYNSEIDGLFYLYSDALEEAYENAGCYSEPPENYKAVCIYFYIEQEVYAKLEDEIKPIFEEWFELPTQEDVDEDKKNDIDYDGEIRTAELLKEMLA